ncbi:hypothetical protein Ancab_017035 [Ancistrocladus abbreviatus]
MLSFFSLFKFRRKFALYLAHSFSSHSVSSNYSSNLSVMLQGRVLFSHLLQIHGQVIVSGAHQDNLIATRLIGHYPSQVSLRVFHQLQTPSIFPFNAIIRVLAEEGPSSQAFFLFRYLKQKSLSPNDFTFSFLLKACLRSGDIPFVKQVHNHIVKVGFILDSFVCNGILTVYAKGLQDLSSARMLFDEMPHRSMVCTWTSLIAGYAQSGESEGALKLFYRMVTEKLRPNRDTMVSVLSACGNLDIKEVERWVNVFSDNTTYHGPECFRTDSVNTILIYLYGKLGKIEQSRESFDEIGDIGKRSVIDWNAMISSYVQNGCALEALVLFRMMMENPYVRPNHVTMVSILSACAQIGDIGVGIWVHEYLKSTGHKDIIKTNSILATALIDMYSKSGHLRSAKEIFNNMVSKDVVSLNVMMMGLAVNGEGDEALRLFSDIQELGFHPNTGTLLAVLCACCHSGMLEKGHKIFRDMKAHFCIPPQLEHYACYIDLLARFGLIEEAFEVIKSMPFKPNNFVWGSLLGGCLLHCRVELTQEISRRLVEVDPENSAGYVMFSNALALDCQWDEVLGLRGSMRDNKVKKQPGCSWISIGGIVHKFLAGPSSHPEIESIRYMLGGLLKEMKIASPWKVITFV